MGESALSLVRPRLFLLDPASLPGFLGFSFDHPSFAFLRSAWYSSITTISKTLSYILTSTSDLTPYCGPL